VGAVLRCHPAPAAERSGPSDDIVPQHAGFGFEFVQASLHHVADADDPAQPTQENKLSDHCPIAVVIVTR